MAAKVATVSLLPYSQVRLLNYRHGPFGRPPEARPFGGIQSLASSTEFIGLQRQPLNQVHGTVITGGWIGTYYQRVIDGRMS